MALDDLSERYSQILRLLRDSRPCRITPAILHTRYQTLRHMARLGWIDLRGGPGTWSVTVTDKGVARLRVYDREQR